LFSGINNWLPEFDAASQDGLRLTNFFANGFTTEQGLIALLTGEPPIARPVQAWTSEFEQFNHPRESLPGLLGGRGYSTHFLTTGNLGFLNKGRWLRELGFHQVEGHDAPFYEGMRRFSFDAAPDDALYGRALQEIDGLAGSHPYFMTLETVTTHAPYVDPVKGVISQEGVVRYADRQLGRFVDQLRSRNYFRNGVLIIVGDHRAMTPMSEVERQHFGDRGFARIPLTVLGMNMHGEQKSAFSQTDLLPSICHWVGNGRQCLGSDQGVFLPAGRQTPSCIYTQRSYEPNDVVLQCGAQDHTVRLNGDETGYVVGPVGSPALLNEVNRLRLGMGLGY
jgi:arylsulfatase A-like enzyme